MPLQIWEPIDSELAPIRSRPSLKSQVWSLEPSVHSIMVMMMMMMKDDDDHDHEMIVLVTMMMMS